MFRRLAYSTALIATFLLASGASAQSVFPTPVGDGIHFGMGIATFKKLCPGAKPGKRDGEHRAFETKKACHNPMFTNGQTTYMFRGDMLTSVMSFTDVRRVDYALALSYGAVAAACWAGERHVITAEAPMFRCEARTFSVMGVGVKNKNKYRVSLIVAAR